MKRDLSLIVKQTRMIRIKWFYLKLILVKVWWLMFDIKISISTAPILVSPNYEFPFKIYSFASKHSFVGILTQKREKEDERPIAFMSFPLKNAELNYSNLDKQSFALIKVVKNFYHYILRSKVYAIVPDLVVKTLLIQNELDERWGNGWPYFKNLI